MTTEFKKQDRTGTCPQSKTKSNLDHCFFPLDFFQLSCSQYSMTWVLRVEFLGMFFEKSDFFSSFTKPIPKFPVCLNECQFITKVRHDAHFWFCCVVAVLKPLSNITKNACHQICRYLF